MGPAEPIMTNFTTSKDDTLFRVPKLANDGSNWVAYKTRMKYAIASRGLTEHLDGTLAAPAHPTGDDQKAIADYQSLFDTWNQNENLVRAQLAASIDDSMLMKLSHCDSATHMWKSLCHEFEGKMRMVQVDLRRKMLEIRANEGDNIPAHLDAIRHIYERLSGMGAPPSEDNYSSMIILSLPESYQVLLTTLGDAAQQANNPLTSDNYITKAVQEYE